MVMVTEIAMQELSVLQFVRSITGFGFLGGGENSYRRTKSRKGYS